MPTFAGVVEPPFKPRLATNGVSDVAHADGRSISVLHPRQAPPCAARLLDDYRRRGVAAIRERSVDCSVVLIDEPGRMIVLSRDRVGLQPFYYQRTNNVFSFGATISATVRTSPRPNRATLASLLVHRSAAPLGATYFEDVHALPPGETLVYDGERLQLFPATEWWPADVREVSFEDATREFSDVFGRIIRNQLGEGATAALVSGGLDSAAILASVSPTDITGITYGLNDGSPADEKKYIAALQHAGYRIERVSFDPVADVHSIEANVRALETPLADDVSATLARAAQCAKSLGCNVLLIGTWGDQVLAPFPPAHLSAIGPYRLVELWRVARLFQRWMTDVPTSRVFESLIRQSLRAHLPPHLLRSVRKRRANDALFDLLAREYPDHEFDASPRSYREAVRHNVASVEHLEAIEGTIKWGAAHGLGVRLPFLDAELLQLLAAFPDEVVYHDHALKPLLRTAMKGRMPAEILQRRDKGDYTEAIARETIPAHWQIEAVDGLRRFVEFGLMSKAQAERTLAKLQVAVKISNGRADLAGYLLSIDMWLRIFFEAYERRAEEPE